MDSRVTLNMSQQESVMLKVIFGAKLKGESVGSWSLPALWTEWGQAEDLSITNTFIEGKVKKN